MSTAVLDRAALIPATLYARLRREPNRSAFLEELASLRFSIVLLARWQASDYVEKENRDELCHELARLRSLYFDTIDEMAMAFGVQQAMNAQKQVERTVEVPPDMLPPVSAGEDGQQYF
jgi:hypothetical protein